MPTSKTIKDDILDSIGEGLFTVDQDFRINFINRAAEKITGLARDEVVGKFCKHVFKSEFCQIQCPIAAVLESGNNIYEFESKIQCRNGSVIPIKLNAAVLKNGNKEPVGGVVSFRDISHLKDIQDYLSQNTQFYGIVGHSKPMKEIYELIREISETDAPVFITGETGTGKEMVANAIQRTSRRRDKRFVKVNCSVLPPQLLASELFGHTRGAFTGAVKERVGRFEFANGGTLLLDEIAEMPLQMQLQLLRILQDGSYERIGESNTRKADVRILAATNLDINTCINQGRFREDLFYRLNVIPITVPPLRKRKDDIPFLVKHFLHKFSIRYKKSLRDIDDSAIDLLMMYDYPGNVRELENILEYAYVRAKNGDPVCLCCLPPYLRQTSPCPSEEDSGQRIAHLKSTTLIQLLEKHRWNKSKVAHILGVNRTTVWRRLKALGLDQ